MIEQIIVEKEGNSNITNLATDGAHLEIMNKCKNL